MRCYALHSNVGWRFWQVAFWSGFHDHTGGRHGQHSLLDQEHQPIASSRGGTSVPPEGNPTHGEGSGRGGIDVAQAGTPLQGEGQSVMASDKESGSSGEGRDSARGEKLDQSTSPEARPKPPTLTALGMNALSLTFRDKAQESRFVAVQAHASLEVSYPTVYAQFLGTTSSTPFFPEQSMPTIFVCVMCMRNCAYYTCVGNAQVIV
jgi:hypothetical protein